MYATSPVHAMSAELLSSTKGHKFRTKDKDDGLYWIELRTFSTDKLFPLWLKQDNQKLNFAKRAQRYLL